MMYEGFTNRQIASALHISEGTARNYISTIYEKLQSESRADAMQTIKKELS
jgi:DNA-binding NarL/FixJ family response regulator